MKGQAEKPAPFSHLQEAPHLIELSVAVCPVDGIVDALGLIVDHPLNQCLFAVVPYVLAKPDRLAPVFVSEATVLTGEGVALPATVEALFQGAFAVVAVIPVALVVGMNGPLAARAGVFHGTQSANQAAECDGVSTTATQR